MKELILAIGILMSSFFGSTEEYVAEPIESITEISQIENVEDAREYIVSFYPVLEAVAQCESSWRPDIKNPHSNASGIFQFLDSTAKWVYDSIYGKELNMEDKNGVRLQVEMAVWLYERYKLDHWICGTLVI